MMLWQIWRGRLPDRLDCNEDQRHLFERIATPPPIDRAGRDSGTGKLATAVPRELGAVVTGLLMAGRSGSAMTASIGAMHIIEEYAASSPSDISTWPSTRRRRTRKAALRRWRKPRTNSPTK